MNRVDLCDAVKLHKVPFVLNPDDEWARFPGHLKPLVNQQWKEFKYFIGNTNRVNPEISNIPNNCGGIYLFYIKPDIIPNIHQYLAYIGRAKKTQLKIRKKVDLQSERAKYSVI